MEPNKTKEPVFWIFLFSAPCPGLFLRQISVFEAVRFLRGRWWGKNSQGFCNSSDSKTSPNPFVMVWWCCMDLALLQFGVLYIYKPLRQSAHCVRLENVLLGDLFAVGWAAPQAFRVYMRCRNGCWYIAYTHVKCYVGQVYCHYNYVPNSFCTVWWERQLFTGSCDAFPAIKKDRMKTWWSGTWGRLKKNRKIL